MKFSAKKMSEKTEAEASPAGGFVHHSFLENKHRFAKILYSSVEGASRRSLAKKTWLMIYISLFSSLLAFFLLSALLIELEFSEDKRLYQKLVKQIYVQSQTYKNDYQLDWLQIDNTLNHGVRLSFDQRVVSATNLADPNSEVAQELLQFDSAQAKIHPQFVPYLLQIAGLLQDLRLADNDGIRQVLANKLQSRGKYLTMQLRVAGHTDAIPMQENARFKDNVELSSFRAFAVMRYLQTHSFLPRAQFSIAGYGSFKPLAEDVNAPENRRIEIYITPVIKPLDERLLNTARTMEATDGRS